MVSALFFHQVGSERTQVVRPGSKFLCPRNHLPLALHSRYFPLPASSPRDVAKGAAVPSSFIAGKSQAENPVPPAISERGFRLGFSELCFLPL